MTLKRVTLWSFLTQSNAKREISCPDDVYVTIEEFAKELKFQLEYNRLPAIAELVQVEWDNTNTTQKLILVRYTDSQSSTNILQDAVGLEQLGRFVYLEKKTYLNPPYLPSKRTAKPLLDYIPREDAGTSRINDIGCAASIVLLLLGSGFTVGGFALFSFSFNVIGSIALAIAMLTFVLVFNDMTTGRKRRAIEKRNLQIDQQNEQIRKNNETIAKLNQDTSTRDAEWEKNLARWQAETLEVAYLATANDVFGRWTSAVSTTIDQIVQKLFIDRHAQAQQWQENQKSQEDIKKELERRNIEMFG